MYYAVVEVCPKCGGEIQSICLTSNPPINKKVCTNCGASWTNKPTILKNVFNPEEQGYTETNSGGVNSETITTNN